MKTCLYRVFCKKKNTRIRRCELNKTGVGNNKVPLVFVYKESFASNIFSGLWSTKSNKN